MRRGQAPGDRVEPARVGEQVGQQLLGRQRRPQRVQLAGQLPALAQLVADVGQVAGVEQAARRRPGEPARHLLGQQAHRLPVEDPLGLVVRAARPPGTRPRGVGDVAVQPHPLLLDDQLDRAARHLLAVADRRGDHTRHLRAPLDLGDLGRLGPAGVEAGEQLPDRAEHDAGLPQRRQHLADVAQERGVRADDQHAAAGEPVAVGVEQVGRAVQGHRGLAGARTALHHEHPGRRGPDDAVLLGLDRRDDVAHPPGPPGGDRRHQGRLAREAGAAAGRGRVVEVEHLVVDRQDLAAAGAQVPPAAHPLGRGRGGGVERLRRGRAPVHQQRLVVVLLVEQAQPPDVAPLPRLRVEPPERQAVLGRAQGREPVGVHRRSRVALGERLRGAHGLVVQHRLEPPRRVGPALVEPAVEHRDVTALVLEPVAVRAGAGPAPVAGGPRAVGDGSG